jgi:ABC-2 type transport system permease protein
VTGITRLVAEREITETLRKKSFWISAAALLLGSLALVIVPELIGDSNDKVTIATTTDVPADVVDQVTDIAASLEVTVTIRPQSTTQQARQLVIDGDADFGLVTAGEQLTILQRTEGANVIVPIIQEVMRQRAADQIYDDAGVDDSVVADLANIAPTPVEVVDTERGGRQGAAFGLTIVMYLMIVLLSNIIATSVATEKANRVSEVLLAVAPTRSLLFGKVIGMAALGTATLLVGALPVIVRTVLGGDMPEGIGVTLASSGPWFVGGIIIYLLAAAMLGSLADRTEEAGSAVAPLTLMLVAVYIVSLSTLETPIGAVLSIIPLSSPIVMPARIAIGAATPIQIVASLALLAIAVVAAARLANLVYARALVRTGKRLRLIDVLRTPK